MAMRLKVHHETHYNYDATPSSLIQRLHLMPADYAAQKVVTWKITAPGVDNALVYRDGFGNTIHLITARGVSGPHVVVAEGEVETTDASGLVKGLPARLPDAVFLRQTRATLPSKGMRSLAQQVKGAGNTLQQAHALMNELHSRVAYEVGASHAHTTAEEAFAEKRGVCQDHAHIMAGIARDIGIPARYVTGYLVTGVGASSDAGHAWAELLVPDLGWVGFDPANNQCPTDKYVRLAAGLDAAAVAPLRGLRQGGGGSEELTVAVTVEIAQQ